jgi:sulfate adenylyltransferase subunit 1
VVITLEEEMDLSRGDMIVRPQNQPRVDQDLDIMICWFDHSQPLRDRGKYLIRHTTREARCIVKNIQYKLDINTLHRNMEDRHIGMNDIARVQLRVTQPLFTDPYTRNRQTGSIILIDEFSNNTVAAGMVIG